MQTLQKLPSNLTELKQLLDQSSSKGLSYLEMFHEHQPRTEVKMLVQFVDKETVSEIICTLNSLQAYNQTVVDCLDFCQNYRDLEQRSQNADKEKALNLSSTFVFAIINLLSLTLLYAVVQHSLVPELTTISHARSITSFSISQSVDLLSSLKPLLWPLCLAFYTLMGVMLSGGLLIYSIKSFIAKIEQLSQTATEKHTLIYGINQQ